MTDASSQMVARVDEEFVKWLAAKIKHHNCLETALIEAATEASHEDWESDVTRELTISKALELATNTN